MGHVILILLAIMFIVVVIVVTICGFFTSVLIHGIKDALGNEGKSAEQPEKSDAEFWRDW